MSLINKYQDYCKEKLENNIINKSGELEINEITNIYEPNNAYNFVSKKGKEYKRGTIKKI